MPLYIVRLEHGDHSEEVVAGMVNNVSTGALTRFEGIAQMVSAIFGGDVLSLDTQMVAARQLLVHRSSFETGK